MQVDTPALSLKISDVVIKGEAIINNRKNKLIPAYEIEVILSWLGRVNDGEGNSLAEPRGRIVLPYISDENHDEVPEMRFSGETEDAATGRLKEAFLNQGKPVRD